MDTPCVRSSACARGLVAHEMQLGSGDEFHYLEQPDGSLVLQDPPADWSRYYPSNYYAYRRRSRLKHALQVARLRHATGEPNAIGWLLCRMIGEPFLTGVLRQARCTRESHILDVGCGHGERLGELYAAGFHHVAGIDPYLPADAPTPQGVPITRCHAAQASGQWDLVMLHHVFEHIADPATEAKALARLVRPGGTLLIRVPLAGSQLHRDYGAAWAQLDAPRHAILHTPRSLRTVIEATAAFRLETTVFDQLGWSVWVSEQYAKGIPAPRLSKTAERREARRCARLAFEYNRTARGDQAAFYFRRL